MNSFLRRIKDLYDLSDTEASIAHYLESKYPASLVGSISQVSKGAGVSISSVSRFIHKLGYENFSDLRNEANIVIESRLTSPIERYHTNKKEKSKKTYGFYEHLDTCVKNISETSCRIEQGDAEKAAKLISDAPNVYVVGGASANALAEYFGVFAKYIRERVNVLSPDISTLAHKLADVEKGDVLLAITHYRVSKITTKVSEFFHKMGNEVILVSDRSINPASPFASVALTVCSGGTPMFSSRVATLAVLEGLINMMIPLNEQKMKTRFGVMEKIFDDYDVYSK